MGIALLLAAYCGLIAAASMLGGALPRLVRMTHLRTQLLISFVAGLMLSIATFQLLPHSIEQLGDASWTGAAVLAGILTMFMMLRAFHVHPHSASPLSVEATHPNCDHEHAPVEKADRTVSCIGMLVGLGIHSLMDGVALAASLVADAGHGAWLGLYGFGTFLAVALHKPLDAFAITSTMRASGWTEAQRRIVNVGFSTISPLGAVLFWIGAARLGMGAHVVGLGLAISAGFFICIALADLLPEVHFHSHDRLALTGALLLGVFLAIGVECLPGHEHGAGEEHSHATESTAEALLP